MAAKLSDKPITKTDLEKFIKTQDDFALELFAYSTVRDLGFEATHAGAYNDPITGKTRQFDVRASRSYGQDLHVYLAIETKSLQSSFPLLISQIPRTPRESFQDVMQTEGYKKILGERVRTVGPRPLRLDGVSSIYPPNQYVGKAVTQVGYNDAGRFVANDSEVYDKWGQAISSVNDLIRRASALNSLSGIAQRSIVLPVLVVPDGTLWITNYADSGYLQDGPLQTDQVQFYIGVAQQFVPNPDYLFMISHLHVVTKSGLAVLLDSFTGGGDYITHLTQSLQESEAVVLSQTNIRSPYQAAFFPRLSTYRDSYRALLVR